MDLIFKSGEEFFEYQCGHGVVDIQENQGMVAIVLDGKDIGLNESTKLQSDGTQLLMISVVSREGGFLVPAQTLTSDGEELVPGDIVIWVPYKKMTAPKNMDSRMGWVGFVVAKVAPAIKQGTFDILCRYD